MKKNKIETTKPFGKGRYLVKEGALYLRELDITDGVHFIKGFCDIWGFQVQKDLNMLLRWQYLSITDKGSPTVSYSTGISSTLGTVPIFFQLANVQIIFHSHTP